MAQTITKTIVDGKPFVNFHSHEVPTPGQSQVLVRWLAAPINPLDLLVIADVYPVKPSYKHADEPIIGYDGVGEVISTGEGVTGLAQGDVVVPSTFGTGTWRSHAVFDPQSLQKVSRPSDLAFAAIIRISIAPAFCLVEDMAELKPGDTIIQNAGTSVVAQFVVQFAHRRGISVINVIRDRPESEAAAVKKSLGEIGADIVVTESELAEDPAVKTKRVKLALDSVFGPSGRALVKALSVGGTYVQLGFLGGPKGQVVIDPTDLFARQITMKGFRGSAQVGLRNVEEQHDLFNWFVELFNKGELKLPSLGLGKVEWKVDDASATEKTLLDAVKRAQQAALGQRKQIILYK
ncbi:GroES-like protein [Saccharata proteae CBS 121410]|uniref:enoyl-[acyl-carrier-protein] reductase n=1 Tax=Saccharata proteae CBS 121410 TaxID=1314787 RepID=A0A9P4HYP9_9PEZI|nr:GroES-like protein [Saccharata proteae CBS 121410]